MKKALCIGINDYPGTGNDLYKCINDMNDWADYLEGIGFQISTLYDKSATKTMIESIFHNLIVNAKSGDVIVMTYSGHGTQVFDDYDDEPDGFDEALYTYDGPLVDDLLRDSIDNYLEDGVTLIIILDSCFSGTATRALSLPAGGKARFMPPQDYRIKLSTPKKKRFLNDMNDWEESMPEILMSGCRDMEYSYEATTNGAFTYHALKILKDNPPMTYLEHHLILSGQLPSTMYPQHPMLEGKTAHKNAIMFEPFDAAEPPAPPESETWCNCFRLAKLKYLRFKRGKKK